MSPTSLSSSCSHHQDQILYFCGLSCLFCFSNFQIYVILCPLLLNVETRSASHLLGTRSSHDLLHMLGLCSHSKGNNQDVVPLPSFPCPLLHRLEEAHRELGPFSQSWKQLSTPWAPTLPAWTLLLKAKTETLKTPLSMFQLGCNAATEF